MTRPGGEQAVVNACIKELDKRRAIHFNVGASNGQTGLVDRIAVYRSQVLFIETKSATGALRAKQRWHHEQLRAAGARVVVARSRLDVVYALDEIDHEQGQKTPANPVQSKDPKRPRDAETSGATATGKRS